MAANDDGRVRYGEIIPPRRHNQAKPMYDQHGSLVDDARMLPSGWGLGNLIETLRHRSAARLSRARTANVEEWTRFLYAMNNLGYAMIERERMRRRLGNLDAILDAEEAHEDELTRINREREIKEAERARDSVNGSPVSGSEPKERPRKLSPEERIRQGVADRKRLRKACDDLVQDILEGARASDTENNPDVQREIDNIKADFAKEIARTYEKG